MGDYTSNRLCCYRGELGWVRYLCVDCRLPLFHCPTDGFHPYQTAAGKRTLPLYLVQPEVIFKRIRADPVQDKFFNLG